MLTFFSTLRRFTLPFLTFRKRRPGVVSGGKPPRFVTSYNRNVQISGPKCPRGGTAAKIAAVGQTRASVPTRALVVAQG
jgi:hypothetical protein